MKIKQVAFIVLFLITTLLGCSGNSPITPPTDTEILQGLNSHGSPSPNRALLGLWEVRIDASDSEIEIIPTRFGTVHLNIRRFLEEGVCTNCFSIEPPVIFQPYGFDIDLSITHPFPGLSIYTVFDVRGIVMLPGTYTFPNMEFLTTRVSNGDWSILDPDGWTPIFNADDYPGPGVAGYSRGKMVNPDWGDPTNTLNPFMAYFSEGQSEDDGGRRAFLTHDKIVRTWKFDSSTDELKFWYAIDACWDIPVGEEPYEIDDFPMSANCVEPYRFDLEIVDGWLWPDGGTVTFGVDIYDHQGWDEPWVLAWEAPECLQGATALITPPDSVNGDIAHWEFSVPNLMGNLDMLTGTELLVFYGNSEPDPLIGTIYGYDRFTIPVGEPPGCNSELHSNFLGTGDFSGGTHMPAYDACFVHDTGTLADGEFMGYISGFAGTVCLTYIIDTLIPESGNGLQGPGWGNPQITQWPVPVSIDVSEEAGTFFICWDTNYSIVEVWSATTGKYNGETDAAGGGRVFCLDTDGNYGFWCGFFPEYGFEPGIRHFVPDGTQPGTLVLDVDNYIPLGEVWGSPVEIIVIPDDRLLVLTAVNNGKVRSYDLTTTPPTFIGELTNLFSGKILDAMYPAKSCDMVADFSETDLTHCRIVIFADIAAGGTELVKIDADLNILAGPIALPTNHYYSIDINPDTGDLALWPNIAYMPGEYALVEKPAGW